MDILVLNTQTNSITFRNKTELEILQELESQKYEKLNTLIPPLEEIELAEFEIKTINLLTGLGVI